MADGFDAEFSELYAHIVESDRPMHQKLTDAIVTLGLPAGSVVVSIGDGTGEPGVRIAKAQPDLKVLSTDASAQMSSMAAEYAAGAENVATVTVSGDDDDLASKCGLAPGSVDVVVLSFSLMFVPDKAKCMATIASLLKPGGKVLIVVLTKFGLMSCIAAALGALLGELPPPPPTNPLSLADPKALDTLVAGAGLAMTSDEAAAYPFPLGPNEDITRKLSAMLMKEKLDEMVAGGKADAVERYLDAFMAAVAANGWKSDGGQVVIPPSDNVTRLVIATKPG